MKFNEELIIEEAINANIDTIDFIKDPIINDSFESDSNSFNSDNTNANANTNISDNSQNNDNSMIITSNPENLGLLNDLFEKLQINNNNITSNLEYHSNYLIELNNEEYELNMKLIDSLLELNDIDCVYHNIILH